MAHVEESKDCHYRLLLEEKKNILWEGNEVASFPMQNKVFTLH